MKRERGSSGSGFGSKKTVPAVPVSAPGKTLPAVPDSGSSSVPENNTLNFDALARLFLTGSHWGQKIHAFKRHQSRNALKNVAGKGFLARKMLREKDFWH